MIVTLSNDQTRLVFNHLVIKNREEIEHLHYLYLYPNFELGYLQHGAISFHQERPKEYLITKKMFKYLIHINGQKME